jgi:cadherin EGF LAG seven-pass G-type receptor 1
VYSSLEVSKVLEQLPFIFSFWQYIPDPSVSEDIATYAAFCLALPVLLAALLILGLIRGAETNSNSIHKNVVACVFLAELMFFVALKARKTLVQHEASRGRKWS